MNLLISTNMYTIGRLSMVLKYLSEFQGKAGVEVFPLYHDPAYEKELGACIPEFSKVPISFHGPYYETEHSAPKGSEACEQAMKFIRQTVSDCVRLNSKYVVFHHNNCRVSAEEKRTMIKNSCENYRELQNMFAEHDIPVVVENAGVIDRGNMMFDQAEFTELCKKEKYPVLIDIGHAHANGWDLSGLIHDLKDQIVAYHIHNNDGLHDSHRRIHDGTLDFDRFVHDYMENTPDADIVLEYSPEVSSDEEGIRSDLSELVRIFSPCGREESHACR